MYIGSTYIRYRGLTIWEWCRRYACIPAIPVIFEVNTLCGLLIYHTINQDFFSNFHFCRDIRQHVIPMIITCTLPGTPCDTWFPRTFYGGKICSVHYIYQLDG